MVETKAKGVRAETMTEQERIQLLRTVRTQLAKIHHELNNPLAIISGNVQLLLEMVRIMGLENDLIEPLEDIEKASQDLTRLLYKLIVLKENIPHYPSE